jgi:primosomal replication protein N
LRIALSSVANQLKLNARVLTRDALRFSPAGVPILNLKLAHRSSQMESNAAREVEMEIDAVVIGALAQELTRKLEAVAADARMQVEGFLARKYRSGPALELHITNFELED